MSAAYKFSIGKQPAEKFPLGVDFAADLATTEIILTATITAIDLADDSDVSATILDGSAQIQNGDQADSKIVQRVKAGTDGKSYKITIKANTDDSNIYEADIVLHVNET